MDRNIFYRGAAYDLNNQNEALHLTTLLLSDRVNDLEDLREQDIMSSNQIALIEEQDACITQGAEVAQELGEALEASADENATLKVELNDAKKLVASYRSMLLPMLFEQVMRPQGGGKSLLLSEMLSPTNQNRFKGAGIPLGFKLSDKPFCTCGHCR